MSDMQREKDLVLNPNEYAYVLDKTKGLISCVVGSYKMSLSTSDALVIFNEKTKRFEETNFDNAITTFISAPENWYITLKNPAIEDKHPIQGTSNPLPELQIGKKVNIQGNVSFALYPGQMAKAIQGHRLHSNQYLLARVYDAAALEQTIIEDKNIHNKYTTGQILVIKGTEVPFYIPPTGIEVLSKDFIPLSEIIKGKKEQYIRDAVTLERLEYCILKDEQGNKKYIHGAAVVFPEPDETFVSNPTGGYKFKAIELSDISGVYVKVIADYIEGEKQYKTGEELFITGKDQMIYYPRPEHAIIDYGGKVLHHAIAIPVGEGRYVLDRHNGNVKMIKGAAMYLPDPRFEVIVKRALTRKQCELWYPDNDEVMTYNLNLHDKQETSSNSRTVLCEEEIYSLNSLEINDGDCSGGMDHENTIIEEAGFSRENTFSKPRTIIIDNKYDGVITIDVWTGYAIHVISKHGDRKVIIGAQTYLMEYDETLEILELSTGKPKTTDYLLQTVFLKIENNKIEDSITIQTKDFVDIQVKISYCVDFQHSYKEKWFCIGNYVKYLCDHQRSIIKREVKKHTIEDFYENAVDIIRNVALNNSNQSKFNTESGKTGKFFQENGMLVYDVEILNITVQKDIAEILNKHQQTIIGKSLELSNASKEMEVVTQLAELEKRKAELTFQSKLCSLELDHKYLEDKIKREVKLQRLKEQAKESEKIAEQNLQVLLDSIQKSELAREKEKHEIELNHKKEQDTLEIARQTAYTDAMKKVIESISPDLIASMTATSNAELLSVVTKAMSPYAMATDSSVSEVVNKLLRGTSLEGILEHITNLNQKKQKRIQDK